MAGSQDFQHDPRNDDMLILLNGDLVPRDQAKVSLFDAGFALGDGVWEGIRVHNGAMLFLEAHLDRLFSGLDQIRLPIPLSRDELTAALQRLVEANSMKDDGHLRLMITRGPKATINQDPRFSLGQPTIACTAEFKRPPDAAGRALKLYVCSIRTSGPDIFDMRLNSHSRMNYILALNEAIDAGADEAIMLDLHGNIASCNATNFFWAKAGTLFTSGDEYCFNGVTRANIIALAQAGEVVLEQGDFGPHVLAQADEAFVTGTMGGVTPVGLINGRPLPGGPLTGRMAAAYADLKDRYAAGRAVS